jgi:hypothetical protein
MLKRASIYFCVFGLIAGVSVLAAEKEKTKKAKETKWTLLFGGDSVKKWRGYKEEGFPSNSWEVVDGTLRTNPKGKPVDLVTKKTYGDFELELDWKVTPGANSGVMYRVSEDFEEPWYTGPEMQVLDDSKHPDGKNPKTTAGSLYALIAPKDKELKPVGEWNHVRLVAKGQHVEHWLNGKKILEYDLDSPELKELIAKSKFGDKPKFAKNPSGHLVLQHHHDEVWFRDVRVKNLDQDSKKKEEKR